MRRGLVLVFVIGCSGGPPVAPVDVSATCAEAEGGTQLRRTGRPYWEPLVRGTAMRDGDWVRTKELGTAHLELLQGGRLDLAERSVVVIEPPVPGPSIATKGPRVGIEEGEVKATLTAADLPLEVRRAGAPVQVLDAPAVYRVVASVDAGTQVTRLDAPPPEPPAAPRDRGVARVGPAPAAFPSSLAPGIDARLKFDPRGWVKLTWTGVVGAQRYRVQLARDWSFSVETKNAEVEGTSWLLRPDGVGLYVWRVAALSASGAPGEFGYARRLFLEQETPTELLISPIDGFVSLQPGITFSWQINGTGASYRLMVSKGPDPQRAPVYSEVTGLPQATATALQPGTYHWGVYEEGAVLRPLFLKPRKLVVKGK